VGLLAMLTSSIIAKAPMTSTVPLLPTDAIGLSCKWAYWETDEREQLYLVLLCTWAWVGWRRPS
jgi:hypothetical protein